MAQGADINTSDSGISQAGAIYERMGSRLYFRSLNTILQLIQPWQPDENGMISLMDWHSIDQREMTEDDMRGFGAAGGGYGAYLVK